MEVRKCPWATARWERLGFETHGCWGNRFGGRCRYLPVCDLRHGSPRLSLFPSSVKSLLRVSEMIKRANMSKELRAAPARSEPSVMPVVTAIVTVTSYVSVSYEPGMLFNTSSVSLCSLWGKRLFFPFRT